MENLYDSSYKSTTGTSVLSMVMRKVYGRMFLALVVTALTSLYVASSPAILSVVLGNRAVFFGLMIAELAVVFVVSGMLNKLSTTAPPPPRCCSICMLFLTEWYFRPFSSCTIWALSPIRSSSQPACSGR